MCRQISSGAQIANNTKTHDAMVLRWSECEYLGLLLLYYGRARQLIVNKESSFSLSKDYLHLMDRTPASYSEIGLHLLFSFDKTVSSR